MRQAILESADLGYVNGHANSLQCFLILKGDFWGVRGGRSGLDYQGKGGLWALHLKNLIQAPLGQAELGDNSRAFVGITSSTDDKAQGQYVPASGGGCKLCVRR